MNEKLQKCCQHIFHRHLVKIQQGILEMTQKSIAKCRAQRGSHSNTINLSVIFSIKNEK